MNRKFLIALALVLIVVIFFSLYVFEVIFKPGKSINSILEEKRKAEQNVENKWNNFKALNDKILSVMLTGTKQSLNVSGGLWAIDVAGNDIELEFASKTSNIASDVGWIKLSEGTNSVIRGRSDSSDAGFEIQYWMTVKGPWKIGAIGKTSSDSVKFIDVGKENDVIQISLIE